MPTFTSPAKGWAVLPEERFKIGTWKINIRCSSHLMMMFITVIIEKYEQYRNTF
jgi:hypothetical protein